MRLRKRLWIGFGALCALAVFVGWLAWPEDELAGLLRLHPKIEKSVEASGWESTVLTFTAPCREVRAAIPGSKKIRPLEDHPFQLPSGRDARYHEFPSQAPQTCELDIVDLRPPWYQRAWSTIKYRLGL